MLFMNINFVRKQHQILSKMDKKITFLLGLIIHVGSLRGQSPQGDTITVLMKREIGPNINLIQPAQLVKEQNRKSVYTVIKGSFDYSGIFEYNFQPNQVIYQNYNRLVLV